MMERMKKMKMMSANKILLLSLAQLPLCMKLIQMGMKEMNYVLG